ncbi:MAG: hypothetical protein ACRDRU_22900 [Pseudonocardiaceae bacterium]
MADSPELAAAKRLLGLAKNRGFRFWRTAPGADGPVWGERESLVYETSASAARPAYPWRPGRAALRSRGAWVVTRMAGQAAARQAPAASVHGT